MRIFKALATTFLFLVEVFFLLPFMLPFYYARMNFATAYIWNLLGRVEWLENELKELDEQEQNAAPK